MNESYTSTYVPGAHGIGLFSRRRVLSIRWSLIWRLSMWWWWWLVSSAHRRCRRISGRRAGRTPSHEMGLEFGLLHVGIAGSQQSVLNGSNQFKWEDRFLGDGPGYRFLPCLQHFVHLSPCRVVDFGVGTHEDLIELGAEI